jgi:NitT/TauT family transport system permease protein
MNQQRRVPLWAWQLGLLLAIFVFWWAMTTPGLLPNFMFDNDRQAAFFFGEPVKVAQRIWTWFVVEADIYRHLAVTLVEPQRRGWIHPDVDLVTFAAWIAGLTLGRALIELDPLGTNGNTWNEMSVAALTAVGKGEFLR